MEDLIDLEVIYLINKNPPPTLFYQDIYGEYQQLKISRNSRGKFNKIPKQSKLPLYHEVRRDGTTVKEHLFDAPIPSGAMQALMLFYLDENGKVQYNVFKDSIDHHGGGDLRVINLTAQNIVCLVDKSQVELPPYQDKVVNVLNNNNEFSFAFALLEPQLYRSPQKSLPMRAANHRITIVFSNRVSYVPSGEGNQTKEVLAPDMTRMYDRLAL